MTFFQKTLAACLAVLLSAWPCVAGQQPGSARLGREALCMAKVLFGEARPNPEGLVSVGTVVLNRVEKGAWGDDVCSVAHAKGQFVPVAGAQRDPVKWRRSVLYARMLLEDHRNGQRTVMPALQVQLEGCHYFHTTGTSKPQSWGPMRLCGVVAGHRIYAALK